MQIHVLKQLNHDRLGRVNKGAIVDMPEPWASKFVKMGAAEFYQTKVERDRPLPQSVEVEQSSSSAAAQASQPTTSKPSDVGVKPKRTRRKKEPSSS